MPVPPSRPAKHFFFDCVDVCFFHVYTLGCALLHDLLELNMANATPSVDQLSKAERSVIVSALVLKRSSIMRSAKAETNSEVVQIRSREVDEVNNLIQKFS